MPQNSYSHNSENQIRKNDCILALRVNNHPGVMSHICGLFSRRAFNVEKILCLPIDDGKESKIYLMIAANQSLEQIIKQLLKLEDVSEVLEEGTDKNIFDYVETLLRERR